MKPYDGIEVSLYFVLAILALLAAGAVFYAFKVEKKEKTVNDSVVSRKMRYRKYGVFGFLLVVVTALIALSFTAASISKDNYRAGIVEHIESNGVTVVEGFVDPSIPLVPNSQAKFVVETDNGLVRCRANAAGSVEDIEFVCQDAAAEDKPFTIPLSEVNNK